MLAGGVVVGKRAGLAPEAMSDAPSGDKAPVEPAHEAPDHGNRPEGGSHEIEVVAVISNLPLAVEPQAGGTGIDKLQTYVGIL